MGNSFVTSLHLQFVLALCIIIDIFNHTKAQLHSSKLCVGSDLKQRLILTLGQAFHNPQTVTDEAIDKWGLRLRACDEAKGRHLEH